MNKKPNIGRAEVEVLRWIADQPEGATVTEVGYHLAETKGQTRNTALNVMERLRQKGFLTRRKKNGTYRYFASESKGRMFESFVEDFVDTMLGGSVAPLVAYLSHRAEVDDSQLEELLRMVKSLEESRNDS